MNHFNPQSGIAPSVLATDLDGTLIPLPENEKNNECLISLNNIFRDSKITLVYATGRHFESVEEAMEAYGLPTPDWIVCDVGSAIYHRVGQNFEVFQPYEDHLTETAGGVDREAVEKLLEDVEGLEPQPPDHQQRFKISYQSHADTVDRIVDEVSHRLNAAKLPYDCMGSLDPFLNCGLLDVMPSGVSKAYALLWLSTHADFKPDEVIYSGDSGNDYAALVSGFRAIIVSNHSTGLDKKVTEAMVKRDLGDRIYLAKGTATSGVLEGCHHYGLFPQ